MTISNRKKSSGGTSNEAFIATENEGPALLEYQASSQDEKALAEACRKYHYANLWLAGVSQRFITLSDSASYSAERRTEFVK